MFFVNLFVLLFFRTEVPLLAPILTVFPLSCTKKNPKNNRSRSHRSSRRRYSRSRSHSRRRRSRSRSRSSDYRRRRSHSRSPMSNRRRHIGNRVCVTTLKFVVLKKKKKVMFFFFFFFNFYSSRPTQTPALAWVCLV